MDASKALTARTKDRRRFLHQPIQPLCSIIEFHCTPPLSHHHPPLRRLLSPPFRRPEGCQIDSTKIHDNSCFAIHYFVLLGSICVLFREAFINTRGGGVPRRVRARMGPPAYSCPLHTVQTPGPLQEPCSLRAPIEAIPKYAPVHVMTPQPGIATDQQRCSAPLL